LHAAGAAAVGGGCDKEAGFAKHVVETIRQMYKPDLLTVEDLDASGGANGAAGMLPLVKHAVDRVVKGANRNCCCCVPCTHVAGRRGHGPHVNWAPENGGGERKEMKQESAEVVAAVHAGALDATIQRVAILDLDGSGGDALEEEVRNVMQDRLATRTQRDASIFYFSPETGGSDAEGRNLVMNIFRPSVGSKLAAGQGDTAGGSRRNSDATGAANGADGKLSAAGTRDLLRQAIATKLVPCLRAYAPDLVIMSAVYPSASQPDECMDAGGPVPLTASDHEWATREIVKVAGVCCKGRMVSLLLMQRSPDAAGTPDKGDGDEPGGEPIKSCLAHVRALVGC